MERRKKMARSKDAVTRNTKPKAKRITREKRSTKKGIETTAGIKKEYLKRGNLCKVTFRLPKIVAPNAKSVYVVGDFNNWNIHAHPMKKSKDGNYTVTLALDPGREYQFRYFVDETKWENDWNADKYVKSPYGDSDNSVVVV